MGQARESSLLFSLQSLLEVERERIDRDRAEQEQRLVEAQRRRELAERQAREAEQARLEQEHQREVERQRLAREEAARLEAIRLAELERVRLEAQHRSQLELATRRQEHEQRLAALELGSGKRRARISLILAAAAAIVGAAGVAVFIKHLDAKNKELAEQQERLIADGSKTAAEAKALLEKRKQRTAELEREGDELRRLLDAKPKPAVAPAAVQQQPRPVRPTTPESSKACDPDDPMAGCLPSRSAR